MTVLKTREYSRFKNIKGNRGLLKSHLRNLMVSLGKSNLLEENPIIVNEKFEVIDGQHRLEAAKQLHLDIYYIVRKNGDIIDVQLLNGAVKAWRFTDYIQSFKAAGNKNYATLEAYYKKYGLSIGMGVEMLTGEHSSKNSLLQDFRDGKFVVRDLAGAELFGHQLDSYRKYVEYQAKVDRNLAMAVMFLSDNKPVSFLDMLARLQEFCSQEPMKRQVNMREYIRTFEEVYNKGKSVNITRFF